MGLGSFVKRASGFGGGSGNDTLTGMLDPSGKLPSIDDWLGNTGADAANAAAQVQAQQFEKVFQLFKPYADTGAAMLPNTVADSTTAGYGKNIGDILNSGTLDPLIRERQDAATAYFAGRGLRRSGAAGRAAADIPADLAMSLESELARRRQGVVQTGLGGAQQAGGALTGIGQALGGGILGAQQAKTQGMQNIASIGGILGGIFSDERLKTNVRPVGYVHNLTYYRWDWNDTARDIIGLEGEANGFMAQEVAGKYPDSVIDDGGFLTINYPALWEELHGYRH